MKTYNSLPGKLAFFFSLHCLLFMAMNTRASEQAIHYTVAGQPYQGLYIDSGDINSDDKAPLVIILHDWDGLTDYEVKRAHMLAELGYSVVAVDMFGAGVRPTKDEDKKHHTMNLLNNRDQMRAVIVAGIDAARAAGANVDNAVVMGYCLGGSAVLELARSGANFKGFATFHGGLKKPEGATFDQIKAKVMVFHGSADSSVTMEDFATLANDLEATNIPHEMITYGGAPHAFTVFDTDRYRAGADQASWAQFLAFLTQQLQ